MIQINCCTSKFLMVRIIIACINSCVEQLNCPIRVDGCGSGPFLTNGGSIITEDRSGILPVSQVIITILIVKQVNVIIVYVWNPHHGDN